MKKESVITAFLGISLGVIIAFVLIFVGKEKTTPKKKIITKQSPSSFPVISIVKEEKRQPLVIEKPDNEFVSDKDSIEIKGKVDKNSLIIIQSPYTEKIIKNEDYEFAINFPLFLGENTLNIIAYHKGESEEKILKIYYLGE